MLASRAHGSLTNLLSCQAKRAGEEADPFSLQKKARKSLIELPKEHPRNRLLQMQQQLHQLLNQQNIRGTCGHAFTAQPKLHQDGGGTPNNQKRGAK